MAEWKLHCRHCNWVPEPPMTLADVQAHMLDEHQTGQMALDLVPHCSIDDTPLTVPESSDTGQCPKCGRFEILRNPEGSQ